MNLRRKKLRRKTVEKMVHLQKRAIVDNQQIGMKQFRRGT